jgi:hypothetical protein
MTLLRRIILICAIIQIVISLSWFYRFYTLRTRDLPASPAPKISQGTVINLLALFGVGYASVFTARTGKFRRTVVTIDWIIAILWTIGFFLDETPLPTDPARAALLIAMSVGVVLPSVINGIAVAMLPAAQSEPQTPP